MVVRYLPPYSLALWAIPCVLMVLHQMTEPTEKTARRTVRLSDQKFEKNELRKGKTMKKIDRTF